jgi:hypothetical protein
MGPIVVSLQRFRFFLPQSHIFKQDNTKYVHDSWTPSRTKSCSGGSPSGAGALPDRDGIYWSKNRRNNPCHYEPYA